MRKPVMVLAVLLATGAALHAQGTTAPKGDAARLDEYLASWEKKMREVKTLSAQVSRIDKDKVLSSTSKFTGYAQYMKSGDGNTAQNLAVLELKPDGKTEVSEKIVCTGTFLYVFAPQQKEIRAIEMPKPKPGQVSDDGFLGLLFGMKSDEAKKRYTMTLPTLKHSKTTGEDDHYVYVDITPRDAKDKADFSRARLVLDKKTFLPRQLWFESANGNESTWDIPRIQSGVNLDRRNFDAPKTPTGWKLVNASREAKSASPQPRVVRPNK